MRRLSLIATPFLAAFALVFGLYHVYASFRYIQGGNTVGGLMLGVFGIVGIGLAVGIWIARRRMLSSPPRPPA